MMDRSRSTLPASSETAAARRALLLLYLAATIAAGCSPSDEPAVGVALEGESSFIAVPRAASTSAKTLRHNTLRERGFGDEVATGDDFYLAIHKREFGADKRWFLSAFLKQSYPAGLSGGAAMAQGTRVVSLIAQNSRVYIVSSDDLKQMSDLFDPQVLIDTYPIVSYAPFEHLPGSSNYVLVDPSSGINKFALISAEPLGTVQVTNQVHVEISMLQSFRETTRKDGITFEQIFSGFTDDPVLVPNSNEPAQRLIAGTLGIGLRRYDEFSGFMQARVAQPDGQDLYFRSPPRRVGDGGTLTQSSLKWGVSASQPIEFVVSSSVDLIQADPRFKSFALYDAIAKGVTNWNQAFGYTALTVRKATAEDDFAQDDKNFIIVDLDVTFGATFASTRSNPNTGEIRGATVYLGGVYLEIADILFSDDPPLTLSPLKKPAAVQLIWEPMGNQGFNGCLLWAPPYRDTWAPRDEQRPLDPRSRPALARLTKKQKVEQYLTHHVLHEIGHALGLRHNFKGSLAFDETRDLFTSSVMDYVDDLDAVYVDRPQSYDIAAIRWLYGLSTSLPNEPFCNDDYVSQDPDCTEFDRTEDPYTRVHLPAYQGYLKDYLDGKGTTSPNFTLNGVLNYVRNCRSPAVCMTVFRDLWNMSGYSLQLGKADLTKLMTISGFGARTDFMARRVIQRMFLDEPALRGPFTADPTDPAVMNMAFTEAAGQLKNLDKIRSIDTRRMLARWMKKLQTTAAYSALAMGASALDSEIKSGSYSGDEAIRAVDALRYMDHLLDPYFED